MTWVVHALFDFSVRTVSLVAARNQSESIHSIRTSGMWEGQTHWYVEKLDDAEPVSTLSFAISPAAGVMLRHNRPGSTVSPNGSLGVLVLVLVSVSFC